MTNPKKVLEDRARRMAARQGLTLVKTRRRDPLAADYDTFRLLDHGTSVFKAPLVLDEVLEALRHTSRLSDAISVVSGFTREALLAGQAAGWRVQPPDGGAAVSPYEAYLRLLKEHYARRTAKAARQLTERAPDQPPATDK